MQRESRIIGFNSQIINAVLDLFREILDKYPNQLLFLLIIHLLMT